MTTYHIGLSAHLLSGQTGYRRAGIHGYILNTLHHLPDADPELRYTVFVGEGDPPVHERLAVRRSRFPTSSPPLRIVWEQALQPFQLGGLDLLHGMAFTTPLLARTPAVVTVYDLSFVFYPERLPASRRMYLRALTGLSCRHARRVIAISRSTADDLQRVLGVPADRIDVALPGVREEYHPLPAGEVAAFRAGNDLPERFFLYLGTLEPRKNVPLLLEAYAALPEATRRAVPLVLVGGKGWGLEPIRAAIVRLGLQHQVRLEGYAADESLPLWYNAASAFVYPSVYEGWGMPVVEALACGTPVLTSNASSLPEAGGDAALLLPPHDWRAWSEGLRRALEDDDWRREAAGRGLAHAAGLTWAGTARATVAAYRKALEGH